MKAGDLVRIGEATWPGLSQSLGIVVKIDDSRRQIVADIMFGDYIAVDIWEGHLEVMNESS